MLALIFNSTAPVLASSWKVNNAQQFVSDDAMMICTGKSFKWISTQAYYDLGELVFIDPPADAPSDISNIDCAYGFILDHEKQTKQDPATLSQRVAYQTNVLSLAKKPYTAYPYQTAHTRAPPLI
ncbi:hypothetical protein [Paraglaciecola sp.]|uniref:hypothetical protein n=1 Tax=Paraglaciecola sp. TaxID=1920173 RepID=UPI003EF5D2B1